MIEYWYWDKDTGRWAQCTKAEYFKVYYGKAFTKQVWAP